MIFKKKWGFGIGTIFSLIVVYFIFLYARDKGWALLAFIAKWYLIIIGSLIALSLGILLFFVLLSLFMLFAASLKLRKFRKKYKKDGEKSYIDVEYKVKE